MSNWLKRVIDRLDSGSRTSPAEPPKASQVARSEVSIELAIDCMTCFPCVRIAGSPWIQLLPTTKLQVEQWIMYGGCNGNGEPALITQMIQRMEHPIAGEFYPLTVAAARRRPTLELGPADILSTIATNLAVWSSSEELESHSAPRFPTPTSEWGRFVAWFNGALPTFEQATALRRALADIRTRELLRRVGKDVPESVPAAVRRLLRTLAEAMDPAERGLPFAQNGVWELIEEQTTDQRLCQGGSPTKVHHPVAIGRTRLWPYLETAERHSILHSELPMVGLRLIAHQVTDLFSVLVPRELVPISGKSKPPASAAKYSRATAGVVTMDSRCPLCYIPIDPGLWASSGNIWCAMVRSQEGERTKTERVHTPDRPRNLSDRKWVEVSAEMISNDYRHVARPHPHLVRPVCVSGYSQEGKTCWLLSLTGNLFYPDGNDEFSRVFPKQMKFRRAWGALTSLNRSDNNLNLFRSLEEMWIDGLLPLPTPIERALSSPIIFRTGEGRQLVIIINDIAGEAMGVDLSQHRAFPHVACSRDVVYIVRGSELNSSFLRFEQFAAGLGQGLFENRQIDRQQMNLILAVSQADRLQLGTGADLDLLNIITQTPCLLPRNHDESEFLDYRRGMVQVHIELQAHLRLRVPNLVTFAEETFGSVRYCGFSAFGHHPLPQTLAPRPDCNGCLVATPRPVRVMDPLLWILSDHGLFPMR